MSSCGLPTEFCFMDLRRGAKVIGWLSLISSGICSILLLVYLCSDFDSIKEELSEHEEHVMQNLDSTKNGMKMYTELSLKRRNNYLVEDR